MPRPSLFDHPKFLRLVHTLGLPEPLVLGHLEYLWRVGCSIGSPVIGDELDIELAAKWAGDPGQLAVALEMERFIDRRDDGRLEIHDLWDHAQPFWPRRETRFLRPFGWVRTRVRILNRDEWTCRYCRSFASTVDHVVPRSRGGSHTDDNLVAACRSCNSRKKDRTPVEAGLVRRTA